VYQVDGQSPEEQKRNPSINYQAISSGYFATMGIRILASRDFTPSDTDKAPGVVIVNESIAKRHWPGQLVVGKHVRLSANSSAPALTVVGVVRTCVIANGRPYARFLRSLHTARAAAERLCGEDRGSAAGAGESHSTGAVRHR
jgi:hypothetical protein